MISVRGVFILLFKTAVIIALFKPIVSFGGLRKYWQKRAFFHKIDLCTQACYSEILPGLYLSNARAACDLQLLQELNITHILTIEAHRLPRHIYQQSNISTLFIRANDTPSTNLLSYFPVCNNFISEGLRDGAVIVHCHFGVSRSATITIAFIMEKYKMTFEDAYEYVRDRRKFINPNPGFITQLKEYERLNYDVSGFHRFEAYLHLNARKHKYKIVSFAAVMVGLLVPIAVMVG